LEVGLKDGGYTPDGWGTGDPSIRIFDGGTTALIEFALLRNEQEKHQWANFYTKIDGTWYDDCPGAK